ncbi:hypothetical protein ElyMa_005071200 [Elysia marginata]|uniref:Uncharacterized protein n=1 Tax=Elysia marginata TaxID=1093978 RepID=A0AAV4JKB1_9GAST|nr:hypothetical protein ElyMa_005071200 [Elysia marginata]
MSIKFETTLTNTSVSLTSIERDLDTLKTFNKMNLVAIENKTKVMSDMITSGKVSPRCLTNDTATPDYQHVPRNQPVVCERGMGDRSNRSLPRYVMMTEYTLQRKVVCDTRTMGKDGSLFK